MLLAGPVSTTANVNSAVAPQDAPREIGQQQLADTSHAELHAFVAALPLERRLRYHDDHYDVPAAWFDVVVEQGARVVTTRELVRRIRAAGLRRSR